MNHAISLIFVLCLSAQAWADNLTDSGDVSVGGQAVIAGSATVRGDAFSVGGGTFVVAGGSITLGGALNLAAAGIKWADGTTMTTGLGKIRQVVKGQELAANFSTTMTTYQDTGVSVSITPTNAASTIFILPSLNVGDSSSGSNDGAEMRIYRVRTSSVAFSSEFSFYSAPGGAGQGIFQMSYHVAVDTYAATTLPLTYRLYLRSTAGEGMNLFVTSGITAGMAPLGRYGNYLTAVEVGP